MQVQPSGAPMALIKYFQFLFFPDGTPVSELPYPVMLLGGNVDVPTFADKAGTTPLANPVATAANGLLTFYAAPGAYATDVSGRLFHYAVDATEPDDAWPGTFVHVQASASSTWTVGHHFGAQPRVDVVDGTGAVIEAEVSHTDDETTVITFGAPTTGTAYLRR